MFVPVGCSNCGKTFQVPEPSVDKPAACPWCQSVVMARPVGAPLDPPPSAPPYGPQVAKPRPGTDGGAAPDGPQARGAGPGTDAPPGPSGEEPKGPSPRWLKKYTEQPPSPPAPVLPPPAPEPLDLDDEPASAAPSTPAAAPPARTVLLGIPAALAVAFLTLAALQWRQGWLVSTEWKSFSTPDKSADVDLVGRPFEDPDAPARGARLFVSRGRYSGVRTWVGWKDLTAAEAQLARAPEGWRLLRLSVFDPELNRLKETFGGYVAKDATVSFEAPISVEFRLETPSGPLVARVYVRADGPRPRAYFVGLVGKRLDPDGPEAERLFDSFRARD